MKGLAPLQRHYYIFFRGFGIEWRLDMANSLAYNYRVLKKRFENDDDEMGYNSGIGSCTRR